MRSAGRTHVGMRRTHNEDALLVCDQIGVWAVFDGLGGHRAGATASRAAAGAVYDHLRGRVIGRDDTTVRDALVAADDAVRGLALPRDDRPPGTTAAVLAETSAGMVVAHVGDSRVYQLVDGRLRRWTADHDLGTELAAAGESTAGIARRWLASLSRCLGAPKTRSAPDVLGVTSMGRFLICTDGLYRMVSDDTVAPLLATGTASESADALLAAALAGGGRDNVTVVVVDPRG